MAFLYSPKGVPFMKRNKLTSIVPKTILGFVLAVLLLTAFETENSNETTPQSAATPTTTPGSGQVADNTAITLSTATEGQRFISRRTGQSQVQQAFCTVTVTNQL